MQLSPHCTNIQCAPSDKIPIQLISPCSHALRIRLPKPPANSGMEQLVKHFFASAMRTVVHIQIQQNRICSRLLEQYVLDIYPAGATWHLSQCDLGLRCLNAPVVWSFFCWAGRFLFFFNMTVGFCCWAARAAAAAAPKAAAPPAGAPRAETARAPQAGRDATAAPWRQGPGPGER